MKAEHKAKIKEHVKKITDKSMAQRVIKQGFYERDIEEYNRTRVAGNTTETSDTPFARRLELDAKNMELELERELKEVWE